MTDIIDPDSIEVKAAKYDFIMAHLKNGQNRNGIGVADLQFPMPPTAEIARQLLAKYGRGKPGYATSHDMILIGLEYQKFLAKPKA
jgi:hypothetical protein